MKDQLGSPRLLVDVATGSVAQTLEYDEWGKVLSDSAPGWQPLGFASGIYDPDTGLVRFGRRDYDPDTGRWTAKDPALFDEGHANLYVYARNNPINNIDPSGLGCFFGEYATQALAIGLYDAVKVSGIIDEVYADALMTGLPGPSGGEQDAFRHCYWSCRMAQMIGPDQAKTVGDVHEQCETESAASHSMDYTNNEVGRGLKDEGDCHDSCIAALNEGNLQKSAGGSRTGPYCSY